MTPAAGQKRRGARRGLLARWVALSVSIAAVLVPLVPRMPGADLDGAWMLAMNEAVARGLRIGEEIIFTFGPYASVYSTMYHPATDALMIAGALVLAAGYSVALLLLMPRIGWRWTVLTCIAVSGLVVWRDPIIGLASETSVTSDGLFLAYGLFAVCGCVAEGAEREHGAPGADSWKRWAIVALFAPLGFLPLIKSSFLVLCAATALLCGTYLVIRRRWALAVAGVGAMAATAVCGWWAAGQPLGALASHLIQALGVIADYTEAMQSSGSLAVELAFVIAATLLVVAIAVQQRLPLLERAVLVLGFLILLFIAFKAAFTRHDVHALVASLSMMFAALLGAMYMRGRLALLATLVALVFVFEVDRTYFRLRPSILLANCAASYGNLVSGLARRVAQPDALASAYASRLRVIAGRARFPDVEGPVDVYSFGQAGLIASGAAWSPRPSVQSYAAYGATLTRLNRDHLASDRAPRTIVFKVEPIDDRLPSMEDGASWPALLRDYRLMRSTDDGAVILARGPGDGPVVPDELVASGTHRRDQAVPVPASEDPLYVRLRIRPTWMGRVLALAYKPPPLRIELHLASGERRAFRLISGMAESGFVVSPLVRTTSDFARLHGDPGLLAARRVRSFAISSEAPSAAWSTDYDVQFIRLRSRARG